MVTMWNDINSVVNMQNRFVFIKFSVFIFFGCGSNSRAAKNLKSQRSWVFLCSETDRKHLLRRLAE